MTAVNGTLDCPRLMGVEDVKASLPEAEVESTRLGNGSVIINNVEQ